MRGGWGRPNGLGIERKTNSVVKHRRSPDLSVDCFPAFRPANHPRNERSVRFHVRLCERFGHIPRGNAMTTSEALYPPEMFSIVEDGVFRSNYIRPANIPFVESLGLKTLVYLSPDPPTRGLLTFVESNDVRFVRT